MPKYRHMPKSLSLEWTMRAVQQELQRERTGQDVMDIHIRGDVYELIVTSQDQLEKQGRLRD